jgi:hypothetical protein
MSVQSKILSPGKYLIADPAYLLEEEDFRVYVESRSDEIADGNLIQISADHHAYIARSIIQSGIIQTSIGHEIEITSGFVGVFRADMFTPETQKGLPAIEFERPIHAIADRGFIAIGAMTIDTSDETGISDDDMIKAIDEYEDDVDDDSIIISKYFRESY